MTDTPLRKHSEVFSDYLPMAERRILDVGCGEGALVRHFACKGAEAVGLDPLPQAIERAEAQDNPPGASFVLGSGEEIPFPDNKFDSVCFFNSLHHVPTASMDRALAEAVRVLQPDGLLYVLEPLAKGAYFDLVRCIEDETEVRRDAIEALDRLAAIPTVKALEELVYDAPYSYESFEDWERAVLSVDPTRAARMDVHRHSLRPRFGQSAERDDKGRFLFRVPSRLTLFAKRA
ncbi:MAG: class I SAM-dependent methyltransferase [Rhodospirillales bacterium]|nr:class I SAM-dependent methyltransferase [Rhodospirillales bacterium]